MRFGRRSALMLPGLAAWPCGPAESAAQPLQFRVRVSGLSAPEGIAVSGEGRMYVTDGKLGVVSIRRARLVAVGSAPSPAGIAIAQDGSLIVANVGLLTGVDGPLLRMDPVTARSEPIAATLQGRPLVASNFPAIARDGSIYCTHSTWSDIRNIGRRKADGLVFRVQPDGTVDVVASHLRSPNGCCFDREQAFLYVALTAEGRIVRFPVLADGRLGERSDFGPVLGDVTADQHIAEIRAMPAAARARLGYCDGIGFDAAGNLLVTLPFANALVALTSAGVMHSLAADPEGRLIAMPTNLAWAGADRRDLLLVCRGNGTIISARTAVPGLALAA